MESRFEDDAKTCAMAAIRASYGSVMITFGADPFLYAFDNFDIAHALFSTFPRLERRKLR